MLGIDPATRYALDVISGKEVAGPYVRLACERHMLDRTREDVYYDHDEYERVVVKFFAGRLRLSEGQFEGVPFLPQPSQQFILGSIFCWKWRADDTRRFRRCYIEMGKGNGKALALDTPIPTPNGWTTMGRMKIGARVFDDYNHPCSVTGVSEVMTDRPCYRVEFSDGERIVADSEHLWATRLRGDCVFEVRTTASIAATLADGHSVDHRRIVACVSVPSVPVRCISVDSDNRMFLCGRTSIPTHNSPLAGGIGIFGMMYDNEPGAQIYSAGSDRNQSDILFQDAVKMAQGVPAIKKAITFAGNAKIWNMAALGPRQKGSFFRPLARTAGKSGSGYRPHFALIDELHEHPNREVIDMLERGFKFRRQPLLFMITNSGTDKNSICWEEHEHAVRVVESKVVDDATFSYVCALDEGDDPLENPSCWKKANPLLGITITEKYLTGVVQQARDVPGKANGILRLHFCVWTDSDRAWLPREAWIACEDPAMTLDEFEGVSCRAGLDLSSRTDMTAKALVFDDGYVLDQDGKPQPKFALFAHGYTPEKTLKVRAREDRVPYEEWVAGGFLTATPGPVVRFEHVIHDLVKDQSQFNLEAVAYDRWLIHRFEEDMADMGADLPLVEHPQGYSRRKDTELWMPGSIELFEELILQRRVRIQVNPALRTAVASAMFVESPASLKRFDKQKATQRIDLLIASTMAVGASCTAELADGISVYELIAQQRLAQQGGQVSVVEAPRLIARFGDEDEDDL